MFLRRLEIEDFRSIGFMDLEFLRQDGAGILDRSLLVGENGTGKSSVLRAAALVLAGSEALAALVTEPSTWVRNGRKSARVAAEIQTAEGEIRRIELKIVRGQGVAELIKRNAAGLAPLDSALEHTARSYFVAAYGASRRLSEDESPFRRGSRPLPPRARAMATMFDPAATMTPLEAWAANLHYQMGSKGLQLIRSSLEPVLNNLKVHTLDKKTHQLIFRTPDGLVPLRQLSDGFQNMVAWCGDLLARLHEVFEDYKNPFSARGLLLVDEIDLHLHPQWQRMLLEFIRKTFPQFQLLATSHSPLTVQQCGPGEVVTITRPADGLPQATRYQADLRRLRVEQVAASPIFGLDSTLSVEAGHRVDQKARTRGRRATVPRDPASILHDLPVPDFQYMGKEDRQRLQILKRLAAQMENGQAKPSARRQAASQRTKRKSDVS